MRIRERESSDEAPVNLMPLIDMVFLLLIFFLVASTFAQEERDLAVQLPGTAVQALSEAPRELIINVRRDGTLRVSGETYSKPELSKLVSHVAENKPGRKVLIRCDRKAEYGYAADVLSLCRQNGLTKVDVGYVLEGGN
ncbi:MAG: ExbD/TolR family protein [Planctomycetota bacterium]